MEEKKQERRNGHVCYPDKAEDIFALAYDGEHKDWSRELIIKSNEKFMNSGGYIPHRSTGLVEHFDMLQRSALVTTIANDPQLRSCNYWPITPMQSESAIADNTLPYYTKFCESLAFILHNTGKDLNTEEAHALKGSIADHRTELGLSKDDLKKRLVVVNAGLESAPDTFYGAKPVVIPGVTEVYPHKALNVRKNTYIFNHGLDRGFPSGNTSQNKASNNSPKDRLYLAGGKGQYGLRVLKRFKDVKLDSSNLFISHKIVPDYMIKAGMEWSENICLFGSQE